MISWFDNRHIPTDISICWLPDWFLNGAAGRQRCILTDAHQRVKEVSKSSSIYCLTNLSTETRRRLPTDNNWRWRRWAVSISNPTHQYSPINWSINWLIDISPDGHNWHRDTSVGQQAPRRITWLIYQHIGRYPYQRTQIEGWRGRAVSISNQRHKY